MKKEAIILNNLNHVFLNNQILTYRKFLFVFLIIFQNFYTYSFAFEVNTLDGFYSNYRISRPFSAFNYAHKSLNYPTLKAPSVSRMDDKNVLNQLLISSILKTSYCTGESSSIVINATGLFNNGNSFRIEISNKNGNFNDSTSIGTLSNFESGTHNLTFKIPTNIPIGNGYRIRAVASNPVTTSADNGFDIQINSIPFPVVSDTSVTICAGQTVRLSATCSQGNVRWYDASVNGNEIITTTILPTITADYFAACEAGIGCASSRTKQHIIVNSINAIIPPFASSCINSDLDLAVITDDVNLNYAWSGPSGFSSTLQNPTITNLTTAKEGVYSVRITNARSCVISATTSVSIGQLLQNLSVVGNVSVCFNGTINLTASTSVGTGMTYLWTGPHSFTATGASISRSAFTTVNNATTYNNGIYTVVASNLAGCTGTTSVDIAVANPPNIPPLVSIGSSCGGVSHTIDWAIRGANFQSYSWSGPNGFTASSVAVCDLSLNCNHAIATIPNFLPENVGIYTIVANFNDEFGNSCTINASQNVTLKPNPDIVVSSTGTACLGDILRFFTTYTDATPGISSYYWTGPNNFTASIQNPTINTNTLAATGVYKLTAVGLNGCVGTATINAYVVESVPPIVEPTATVVLSNSITLTADGCSGTLLWYNAADNESVTMPVSPVVTTLYYAKCNNSGCIGGKSMNISVFISPPIAISVKSGDWEDKYTWDILRVPLAIDSVIIRPNHIVKINSIAHAKWLAWTGYGNIKFASSNSRLNLFGNPTQLPPVIVTPPVINANSVTLTEGIPVVFTASGSGTISWYKNGISLNVNGSTYTVNQPIRGDIYTAKRSVGVVMSEASNALTIVATEIVTPPMIDANPMALIENIPVTFTASGSGVISWYKNGVSLNVNGSTYTVNQPVRGDIYTAKRSVNDVISGASNALTIVAAPNNSNVTITQPNKPAYYFSDGHPASYYDGNINLPTIFTNQPRYDAANDFVWLTNDKIKIGINLKRGGQLAWASLIDATSNLIYNGYDGGFQVTLDAYQRKDGYSQGGEVAGSRFPGMPTSYNVIQGGDYFNHAVTLIDYHPVPNGYYVKVRPIHYPLEAKLSQTYIEATYIIIGRTVKIDYRYTSFRTDGQWDGSGFDGAGAPSCFIVNTLNKYKTYTGNSPWSFLPTSGSTLPITNLGQNPAEAQATEYWGMVYDDQHPNSGIGVYNATNGGNSTYFIFKQLEVYAGNGPGTEFTSGSTFFQPFVDFNNIANHRGNYVKDITSYLMIGSELEIRSEVYKISGHESNIPRF